LLRDKSPEIISLERRIFWWGLCEENRKLHVGRNISVYFSKSYHAATWYYQSFITNWCTI